jgi:hypothetical protein
MRDGMHSRRRAGGGHLRQCLLLGGAGEYDYAARRRWQLRDAGSLTELNAQEKLKAAAGGSTA